MDKWEMLKAVIRVLEDFEASGGTLAEVIPQLKHYDRGCRDWRICDAVAHNLPVEMPPLTRDEMACLDDYMAG